MRRTSIRAAAVAAILAIAVALPVAAGAGGRIPVDSVDDATSPAANRIAAVTNIVNATNARLERVIGVLTAHSPSPCTEICPIDAGFAAARLAYETLGQSVADACTTPPSDGLGDAVINDADAFASDTSQTGIANQLISIATVLGNADDRLGGIQLPNPGPPDSPEMVALFALADAVDFGGATAAGWLDVFWPPNPCLPELPA